MILILCCGLIVVTPACDQDKSEQDVPKSVKKEFNKKFPIAKNVEWEMEKEGEWEAEFEIDEVNYSANFSDEGKWVETEYAIKESDLPKEIKMAIQNQFSAYSIDEMEVLETSKGRFFEILLEKGGNATEIVFNTSGDVISKKAKDGKNED